MPISTHKRFGSELAPGPGRYRLVASGACPYCRRVLIARRLLGLTNALRVAWSYGRGEDGYWQLTDGSGLPGEDPVLHATSVAEVYASTPGYTPPPTIPALVELASGEVVMDSSTDLLFDLATAWKPFHIASAPDLYPEPYRLAIDAWQRWLDEHVAAPQGKIIHADGDTELVDAGVLTLFTAFDVIDTLLARATGMEAAREDVMTFSEMPYLAAVTAVGQYLCGNNPTAADILLFTQIQSYEYSTREGLGSPSISFWPALARWFRALENTRYWVGSEERAALGL